MLMRALFKDFRRIKPYVYSQRTQGVGYHALFAANEALALVGVPDLPLV